MTWFCAEGTFPFCACVSLVPYLVLLRLLGAQSAMGMCWPKFSTTGLQQRRKGRGALCHWVLPMHGKVNIDHPPVPIHSSPGASGGSLLASNLPVGQGLGRSNGTAWVSGQSSAGTERALNH